MTKIQTLSSSLIEKIAAGEVIERPSFAVKELVENAIDAHAQNIFLELEEGGYKAIKVKDDGEGMNKEDLLLSIQPHTTSKLINEEMLHKIETLGFRGEALASIAAISDMSLQSRTKDQSGGNIIELSGSKVKNISAVGMPYGTQIVVDNIFKHVPARKKFTNSPQTEFRYTLDLLTRIAISCPNVGFKLIHNKKVIFDVPSGQDSFERIVNFLGTANTDLFIPILFEDSYIKISGFIAKPQLQSKHTRKEFVFINKRSITNQLIATAVKDAYGELLETSSYPIFLLFFDIPYETLDVNVHPRKEDIHFIDTTAIYNAVVLAVKDTLSKNNLTFENLSWNNNGRGLTKSYSGKLLKKKLLQETKIITSSDIIQLQNTYLVTETKNGIMLVDQHAASERIYYEKFRNFFENEKKKNEKYQLKTPESFTLSLIDKEILLGNLAFLKDIGFLIEHTKNNNFKIISVPEILKDRNFSEIIQEILSDIIQERNTNSIDSSTTKMLQFLACRTAIKAGDKITKQESKELIKNLQKTKNSYVCAHGRPTKIELTKYELEKMFRRV